MGRHLTAVAAATVLALPTIGSPIAFAGVVINETETVVSGQPSQTRQRTIMIEGNKQKLIDGNREIIFF